MLNRKVLFKYIISFHISTERTSFPLTFRFSFSSASFTRLFYARYGTQKWFIKKISKEILFSFHHHRRGGLSSSSVSLRSKHDGWLTMNCFAYSHFPSSFSSHLFFLLLVPFSHQSALLYLLWNVLFHEVKKLKILWGWMSVKKSWSRHHHPHRIALVFLILYAFSSEEQRTFFSLFWMFIWTAAVERQRRIFPLTQHIHDDVTWWWYEHSSCVPSMNGWIGIELWGWRRRRLLEKLCMKSDDWRLTTSELSVESTIWARKVAGESECECDKTSA